MTRFSALALLLLVAAPPAHPQSAPDPAVQPDQYIQQVMADWGTVGLAVAVVKDDRVVFSKGYGVRTKGTTNPVDANTLFAIGSTTKAMTLAAPFPQFSLALLTNPLDNEEPRPARFEPQASEHAKRTQLHARPLAPQH